MAILLAGLGQVVPAIGDSVAVRPGDLIFVEGIGCTAGFLFRDSAGNRYTATAGHCVQRGPETVWAPGQGPRVFDEIANRLGTAVYAHADAQGRDFALFRLDPGVVATPSVPGFGGPTGINDELTSELQRVYLFGRGVGVELVARGRPGWAIANLPDEVPYFGVVTPGDSGAPLLSEDGRALGTHYAQGVFLSVIPAVTAGTAIATRIGPAIAAAEAALGIPLTLQTAPFEGGLIVR